MYFEYSELNLLDPRTSLELHYVTDFLLYKRIFISLSICFLNFKKSDNVTTATDDTKSIKLLNL